MLFQRQLKSSIQRRAFWKQILLHWQKEKRKGVSVTQFCKKRRLSESAFFAWRRKLGSGSDDSAPLFVPLNDNDLSLSTNQPMELVLNTGQVLRIPNGVDPRTLKQVLALLKDKEDRLC